MSPKMQPFWWFLKPKGYAVTLECWGYTYEGVDYHDCISIDGVVYQLTFDRYEGGKPIFIGSTTLTPGDHTIEDVACNGGMMGNFWYWETIGDLTVADPSSSPTTLTVNGTGTLRLHITIII